MKKFTPISKFMQPLTQTSSQMVSLGKVTHKVIENLNLDSGAVEAENSTQMPSQKENENKSDQMPEPFYEIPMSFAQIIANPSGSHESIPSVEHRPEVHLVFLNFKRVGREGYKIPLIQVATAVAKTVGERNVDAVQPMRNGWQIYIKTESELN